MSGKKGQADLTALFKLEFYRKQNNWKFCSQVQKAKKASPKGKSKTPALPPEASLDRSLNKTYSIETELAEPVGNEERSDLNNAFVESDNDKNLTSPQNSPTIHPDNWSPDLIHVSDKWSPQDETDGISTDLPSPDIKPEIKFSKFGLYQPNPAQIWQPNDNSNWPSHTENWTPNVMKGQNHLERYDLKLEGNESAENQNPQINFDKNIHEQTRFDPNWLQHQMTTCRQKCINRINTFEDPQTLTGSRENIAKQSNEYQDLNIDFSNVTPNKNIADPILENWQEWKETPIPENSIQNWQDEWQVLWQNQCKDLPEIDKKGSEGTEARWPVDTQIWTNKLFYEGVWSEDVLRELELLHDQEIQKFKPNIHEFKPNINEFEPNINDFKPNIQEFKPNMNEFKPNIKPFKPNIQDFTQDIQDFEPDIKEKQEFKHKIQKFQQDIRVFESDKQEIIPEVQEFKPETGEKWVPPDRLLQWMLANKECCDDVLETSCESEAHFIRSAQFAPHSSEIDIQAQIDDVDTSLELECGNLLTDAVGALSEAALLAAGRAHARALRKVARELRNREQRNSINVPAITETPYDGSCEEYPTRDIGLYQPAFIDTFISGSHKNNPNIKTLDKHKEKDLDLNINYNDETDGIMVDKIDRQIKVKKGIGNLNTVNFGQSENDLNTEQSRLNMNLGQSIINSVQKDMDIGQCNYTNLNGVFNMGQTVNQGQNNSKIPQNEFKWDQMAQNQIDCHGQIEVIGEPCGFGDYEIIGRGRGRLSTKEAQNAQIPGRGRGRKEVKLS
ncbi:hypothetical protein O0L34_g13448 [Tuta absoluta]|nr:hypothetical protein O0L34_g13448 [Tuta absoluta]